MPSIENREEYLTVDSEDSEDDEQLVNQTSQFDDQLVDEDTIESIESIEPTPGPRRSSRIRDQAYLASTAYLAINDDFEAPTADIKEP